MAAEVFERPHHDSTDDPPHLGSRLLVSARVTFYRYTAVPYLMRSDTSVEIIL